MRNVSRRQHEIKLVPFAAKYENEKEKKLKIKISYWIIVFEWSHEKQQPNAERNIDESMSEKESAKHVFGVDLDVYVLFPLSGRAQSKPKCHLPCWH